MILSSLVKLLLAMESVPSLICFSVLVFFFFFECPALLLLLSVFYFINPVRVYSMSLLLHEWMYSTFFLFYKSVYIYIYTHI